MAYFADGPQPVIDWEARDQIHKQDRVIDELRELLVELLTPEQRDRLLARHTNRNAYCAHDGAVHPCAMVRALTADTTALDPLGILSDEQYNRLHLDLAEMAKQRRRAEVEAANWPMS